MEFQRKDLSNDTLISFYKAILKPRLIEEKMLLLLRQGKVSKWFSGIGQEAVSVGTTLALDPAEWIMPLHRNLGVFTTRNVPLSQLFLQWQGAQQGFSKGRERSFHFGTREHHICGMISHLGPQLSIADGVALVHKLRNEPKVAVAFTGEGGTSEGDFHEALNLAAVWDLPVIFIIENNGYALSTPISEQYRCRQLSDKAKGYGIEGVTIDGNNLLTVYDTIKGVREYCIREQKPYLIECQTFRMRGHEEASGTKYVPAELLTQWAEKDPVKKFEEWLLLEGILTYSVMEQIKQQLKTELADNWQLADEAPPVVANAAEELGDVFAPSPESITSAGTGNIQHLRFVDAIKQGLQQAFEKHQNLLLMGQDVAEYGGAFKITEGFLEQFGKSRIRNTPLCESAVLGAALGLNLEGFASVVEMQFADFVSSGFNQIVNNLAKIHYRWGQTANTVIRLPTGAGVGAGPFHSQSTEAWFFHVPGLKIVYPATPEDAKGLLLAAIEDPNPVLFFEHKALYRSISGDVPEAYYTIPIGKAKVVHEGEDITIITYGAGVHWALEYAVTHPQISLQILDLRSLQPLDYNAVKESVSRTGKVLILHEDTLTGGVGAELGAWIGEHCFEQLDAPVLRCASLDTPVPFNLDLERNFLAKSRLAKAVAQLLEY